MKHFVFVILTCLYCVTGVSLAIHSLLYEVFQLEGYVQWPFWNISNSSCQKAHLCWDGALGFVSLSSAQSQKLAEVNISAGEDETEKLDELDQI